MQDDEIAELLGICRDKRARYEASAKADKHGIACSALLAGFTLIGEVLGQDLINDALGQPLPEDATRKDKLLLLASRLQLMSFLEPTGMGDASVTRAADEVLAIANGDAAFLLSEFARPQGRPINAYRLARHQLRALEWHAFLRHAGNSPASAQNAVAEAYGSTWTTINRWKVQAERELGKDFVRNALSRAAQDRWIDAGFWRSEDEAEAILKRNGAAYQQESRRRMKSLG